MSLQYTLDTAISELSGSVEDQAAFLRGLGLLGVPGDGRSCIFAQYFLSRFRAAYPERDFVVDVMTGGRVLVATEGASLSGQLSPESVELIRRFDAAGSCARITAVVGPRSSRLDLVIALAVSLYRQFRANRSARHANPAHLESLVDYTAMPEPYLDGTLLGSSVEAEAMTSV
jgi:hypothetical protein